MKLCKCGCGREVIQKYSWYKPKYIYGHNSKGRKLTEETKKKISIGNIGKKHTKELKEKQSKKMKQYHKEKEFGFKKGYKPWNKGLKFPKDKYPHYGIRNTDWSKANTGKYDHYKIRGVKKTEEHKRKISQSNKGKNSGDLNPAKRPEVREKLRKAHLGKPKYKSRETWRKKISNGYISPLKGRKRPEHSKILKKLYQDLNFKIFIQTKSAKGLKNRPTSLEKQMINIIDKYNLPYKYTGDGDFWIGHKNPDFVNVNGEKICVEVGNTYHHKENYNKIMKQHYKKYGWKCIVFRTNNLDEEKVLEVLNEV